MSKPAFEVFPYDLDRLLALIADGSYRRSPDEIRNKRHSKYFDDYLRTIDAKTLLVERRYIDRDFLEDYAAYYVRCFPEYEKECTRIHFFREAFTQEAFAALLSGDESALSQKALKAAYLGFVVVKPLPQTVIGRTCLATYPANDTRCFPTARKFEAHLFGIKLTVAQTLPFQEQDSVVAACATSALWTVFQATSRHYYHQILSPIEITRAATHLLPAETRVLPNRGLSTHMMAHAIKSVNLEPYLIRVAERYLLQAAIYSYVHARIPLILGVELVDDLGSGKLKPMGKHALTVVGYNLGGDPIPIGPSQLRLRASRMDKIYVHDDQVGPFARMELDRHALRVPGPDGKPRDIESLSTSWPSDNEKDGQVRAVPDMLLVPLYHKVRISWDWVLVAITEFDDFLTQLSSVLDAVKLDALEWDVYLTTVNEVKEELLGLDYLKPQQKFAALTRAMPRFLWRATATRGTQVIFDLLFDATDIDTGDTLIQALVHDDLAHNLLKEIAAAPDFDKSPIKKGTKHILRWVNENA